MWVLLGVPIGLLLLCLFCVNICPLLNEEGEQLELSWKKRMLTGLRLYWVVIITVGVTIELVYIQYHLVAYFRPEFLAGGSKANSDFLIYSGMVLVSACVSYEVCLRTFPILYTFEIGVRRMLKQFLGRK